MLEEKSSLIKDLLKPNFKDTNTKISKDGLRAYCHYLELFVKEGALRAQIEAKEAEAKVVEFDHLEQVFVQLLLDF